MRVRLENEAARRTSLRWRGVALDTFDNQSWRRARSAAKESRTKGEREIIQVDFATGRESLTQQTIYLEPLDTPVLFGLSRAVGVLGNFPVIYKDSHGALTFDRVGERISYKVLSDRALPSEAQLRADDVRYPADKENYRQLPPAIDPRIRELALQITKGASNRYDASKMMESYLQNNFGYTLEQKASGGSAACGFFVQCERGALRIFRDGNGSDAADAGNRNAYR